MKHWPDFLRPFSTKVCSTNVREVLQAIISVVCVSSPGSLSKNNTVFKNKDQITDDLKLLQKGFKLIKIQSLKLEGTYSHLG